MSILITTNMPFIACGVLVAAGFYIIMFQTNLLKIAIGISVLETGVNLLLVALGYRAEGIAPIFTMAPETASQMVFPVPQALCLTAIVISFATTALLLGVVVGIYKHYGSLDAKEVRRLRG